MRVGRPPAYTSTLNTVPIGTLLAVPSAACPEPGQVPLFIRTWIASRGGPLNAGASLGPTGVARFSSNGVSQTSHQSLVEVRCVETCHVMDDVPPLKSASCAGAKKMPPYVL